MSRRDYISVAVNPQHDIPCRRYGILLASFCETHALSCMNGEHWCYFTGSHFKYPFKIDCPSSSEVRLKLLANIRSIRMDKRMREKLVLDYLTGSMVGFNQVSTGGQCR